MRKLAWVLLCMCACSSDRDIVDGDVRVAFTEEGVLTVTRGETILLTSTTGSYEGNALDRPGEAYAPFSAATTSRRRITEVYGSYEFEDTPDSYVGLVVEGIRSDGNTLHFELSEGGSGTVSIREGFVELSWQVEGYDRLAMSFDCLEADRFFGLGAQVSAEHRGYRVPIWVQEQGNGKVERGENPPVFGLSGYHYQSYAPIPFMLASRPLGFELVTDYRSEFELCEDGERFRVELFGGQFGARIYVGETPAEILESFTGETGRARPVSRWSYGPWVDTIGGPEAILDALEVSRREDIPASAIWAEDWIGKEGAIGGEHLTYNWEEDKELYPDLEGVASAIHRAGMRFLTYVNPMIPNTTKVFEEGSTQGYLVSDADGHPIELEFPFGDPPSYYDMTGEGAREWYWGYLSRAVDSGVDGWMTDYGESLPYEAIMANGSTGEAFHNLYPLHWAQASRDFWAEKRPDGDFAYFNRSGYTGIAGRTHIMWLGDQLVTFDRNDGLGSVLPLYLSAGLSGVSLNHSDVGGYTSFGSTVRTFELWARWVELEAFTPFMRTHHSANPAMNLQWFSSEETLSHFRRYGKWHQRLLPYWTEVVDAASETGAPAVRPLWWSEMGNRELFGVDDAALVGDDLLLAPIVVEGETGREVIFPSGAWHRWVDEDAAFGPAITGTKRFDDVAVHDTLLFVRAGAAIPLLSRSYDTLALERPASPHDQLIEAAPERFSTLTFALTLGGRDTGTLSGHGFGEVAFTWDSTGLTRADTALVGGSLQSLCEPDADDCIGRVTVSLEPGENVVTLAGSGEDATFTIEAESLTEVILELR